MQPRRLSLLGVGLLGGSIGLAVRSRLSGCRIVGYGHRRETLDAALDSGAIDEAYDQPGPAVQRADLVILCTPVGLLQPLLSHIGPALAPGAIVTDVGSTKRSVVAAAHQILPQQVHFIGSHPMAGSEKRGVQYARADLFDGAVCITTPDAHTDASALQSVESFWQLLGMRVTRLDPGTHDRLLSDISHLPHAVAAALVSMQQDEALDLCGKGFLDLTRIAGGDGGLWRDILLDNRDNVRRSVQRLHEHLSSLLELLDEGKEAALKGWLDTAAARRQALLDRRPSPPSPDRDKL